MKLTHDIVVFGIQGSGKTTQAEIICQDFDATLFSFGREIRTRIAKGDKIGQEIAIENAKGELATPEIVEMITSDFLKTHQNERLVFDSPVRRPDSIPFFQDQMQKNNRDFIVIFFHLSEEATRARIKTQTKRDDASETAIARRLEIFHTQTIPAIEHFRQIGISILDIDASPSIPEIATQVKTALAPFLTD